MKKILFQLAFKKPHFSVDSTTKYIKYLFQQISKFLEDSMDVFYGIRTLKSIDYSKNN